MKVQLSREALLKKPMIIDGGFSTELNRLGYSFDSALWTAEMLLKNHDAIVATHRSFLQAGAKCIISSSYQANIATFKSMGLSYIEAREMLIHSVRLARQAVSEYTAVNTRNIDSISPFVAASIGPYGAYLADGSEYKGNYGISKEELRQFHQEKIDILDSSGADLLACETIPDIDEAKVLAKLLYDAKTPAWICFSCRDEAHLHDGTAITEAAKIFAGHPNVIAVGVNCTAPRHIKALTEQIKSAINDKLIIIYPNSGEVYDSRNKSWLETSDNENLITAAKQWHAAGAHIIGGCCRIDSTQIKALCNEFG